MERREISEGTPRSDEEEEVLNGGAGRYFLKNCVAC